MASKYLQKYPVPSGFPDILHHFAKEILRDQPENVKEFGYLYFKALEEVRHQTQSMLLKNKSVIFQTSVSHLFLRECLSITRKRERRFPRLKRESPSTPNTQR